MLIYIVMHYHRIGAVVEKQFWKPSDFGIQQSIFTVKITAIGAHEPGCETIKTCKLI